MNYSPEEGNQNPPGHASPSQRLIEFLVQRGIGSAKSPVSTTLLIAAIGSLSAFGALTIFYQVAIHFIHPDTALWLCVAIPCAAPFVFALTRRHAAVVQTPLSDEPKAIRHWTTTKPWIALALSMIVGIPVVFALRPLISSTSNDVTDRQAGRILICIVLCIHYLAAWMLLCWLGRYFKLQTQSREDSSPGLESPWQSDWKSAPWWAIGFCAAAALFPRTDNGQPGVRERSATSASANLVVQRNQKRQATATYWQADTPAVYAEISRLAAMQGFLEIPERREVAWLWSRAYDRDWIQACEDASRPVSLVTVSAGGFASQHSQPAANVSRGRVASATGESMQSAPRRREVSLFCDGSCLGSRGVGAWAYLLIDRETGFQQWNRGADLDTTNNRMELMAVIQGLSSLPESSRVHLVVDSQYVSLGVTERLQIWMARGWRSSGAGSRRVMNVDLWERLAEQLSRHEFDCQWVRGHSGHPENEFVDQMARTIAEQAAALQRGGLMSG